MEMLSIAHKDGLTIKEKKAFTDWKVAIFRSSAIFILRTS